MSSLWKSARAVVLKDLNKVALVKRVRELESRGFECVKPIYQETKGGVTAMPDQHIIGGNKYRTETSESTVWIAVMSKVKQSPSVSE